ncbi:MAG TPA: hypothetical protein VNW30_04625 [Opitutaceae bacterium]|jgi:hypothetical protein|nr:hypothetical protein [Opitutaceae bacterium]
MNTAADLTRQQLQAMADTLMLQYGTVLFLKLAYLAVFLVLIGILFGGRRLALGFLFLTGALTFLVPSNLTMVGSPVMMMLSLLGWVWLTLQRRKEKRRAAQASGG